MKVLLISIARAGNICISSLVNLDVCVKRGERIISGFDNSLLSHGEEHIDGILTYTIMHLFPISPGITVNPREIQDNGYVKFWGVNKMLYRVYVKMVNTNFFFKVSKKIN